MKNYTGIIPPCGIFCGGCPKFERQNNPCDGAQNSCRKCKSIYECCVTKRGHQFCYQCSIFPCARFRKFSATWQKYGQDLIENQNKIKAIGEKEFIKICNKIV